MVVMKVVVRLSLKRSRLTDRLMTRRRLLVFLPNSVLLKAAAVEVEEVPQPLVWRAALQEEAVEVVSRDFRGEIEAVARAELRKVMLFGRRFGLLVLLKWVRGICRWLGEWEVPGVGEMLTVMLEVAGELLERLTVVEEAPRVGQDWSMRAVVEVLKVLMVPSMASVTSVVGLEASCLLVEVVWVSMCENRA